MSSRKLLLVIALTLAAAMLGAFLTSRSSQLLLWIPVGISIGSLVVSLLGAFKNDFFAFAPSIHDGEVILTFAGRDTDSHSVLGTLTFRLHFLNRGYGDGVIQAVSVKAMRVSDSQKAELKPVIEIDMEKFFQNRKHHVQADDTLGPFVTFLVPSKAAVSRACLFVSSQPALALCEGTYRFDVHVKSTGSRGAPRLHRFERVISRDNINDYQSGSRVFLDP